MILGLGSDSVDIRRIERSIERYGERFTRRCFTPREIEHCSRYANKAEQFAGRIAVKEAASKALGTGWRQGVHWKCFEISHEPSGKPFVRVHGRAAELAAFHKRIMESLRIALGVFMSGNAAEARKLIAEKAQLRNAEIAAAERHMERLREARPETLETTSLHLDVLRDLKRIHSHICSVAYSVLEGAAENPAADLAESDPITLVQPAKPTVP